MTSPFPETLAAVKPKGGNLSAGAFVRADGTGLVAFLDPGTLVIVVGKGRDKFGRRMMMVLVVQQRLVWVYNEDLKEVTQ